MKYAVKSHTYLPSWTVFQFQTPSNIIVRTAGNSTAGMLSALNLLASGTSRNISKKYCPTDPRLFLTNNVPATPENAVLTQEACKVFAPPAFTFYPTSDIWGRLQTWKFPLLQLIASSPRLPLRLWVEGFVIVHLMGDPIGTIKDLLRKLSLCEERAAHFATYFADRRGPLTEGAWKAVAMITISYDEWGEGNATKDTLQNTLDQLLPGGGQTLEKLLQLCRQNSDALAADRATAFLPIFVAQSFFVAAIAVAIAKTSAITSTSSIFVNVEAHSIAFSALYFWIVPASSSVPL